MSNRKANIRSKLKGERYLDGDNIFILESVGTEPLARMRKITGDDITIEQPISYFKDFVLLKPVVPRVRKPKPERKPRSDKGKGHRRKTVELGTGESNAG